MLYGVGNLARENIQSLLRSLPGHALQLGILQQDPNYPGLSDLSNCAWAEKLDYMQTARIRLDGTFQEYWAGREDRLRRNNDRLRRRIAEKGLDLEFIVIRDAAVVAEAIREFGQLESKGWKAR